MFDVTYDCYTIKDYKVLYLDPYFKVVTIA